MVDETMTTVEEKDEFDELARRSSRRQVVRRAARGVGLLALSASGLVSLRQAIAKDGDEEDEDNSGSGSGGDDHSGHGGGSDDGGSDDDDDVAITGEIPAGSVEVRIVDDDPDGFSPANLTVDVGQAVTFVNAHDDPHTATGSGFDTGIIQPGGTATVVLDESGTFAYACQIHPEMTGSIGVRGADGAVASPVQDAAPAEATAVQIVNFAFDPPTVTVPVGTTVAWTNADSAPHTVTAVDGAFDSDIFDPGGVFTWEFTTPGAFAYRCNLHPQMEGMVEVTGDGGAAQDDASEATPVAEGSDADVVGVWTVTFTPAADSELAPRQAIVTFDDGGTVAAENAEPLADNGLEMTLGPVRGTWTDDGSGAFRYTAIAFILDEEERYGGTLTFQVTGDLDDAGDAFSGECTIEAVDASGEEFLSGDGTIEGERV